MSRGSSTPPSTPSSPTSTFMPSMSFMPPWADPDWVDDGEARQQSDHPIRSFEDRFRPALLDSDKQKNPTAYARRFGIYPGRSDGRSRTSPTRATSRTGGNLPPGMTGADVHDVVAAKAAAEQLPIEDFLLHRRPDIDPKAELADKALMRSYHELLTDELWQGFLFGNMTMDELQAGDNFVMGPASNNLAGISKLFSREKWVATGDPQQQTDVYCLDGKFLEMNANTEDAVWDALQPALMLATKLISVNPRFLATIADIRKMSLISRDRDPRTDDKIAKQPLHRAQFAPAPNNVLGASKGIFPRPEFDPVKIVHEHIERSLIFGLASGGWTGKAALDGSWVGITQAPDSTEPWGSIEIYLATEVVWPLLTDTFSASEKMMSTYLAGITLAHEFMHAICITHLVYLENPATFGITDPQDLRYCSEVSKTLPIVERDEVYYEDDPWAETGHAFENDTVGFLPKPIQTGAFYPRLPELISSGGITVQSRWLVAGGLNDSPELKWPALLPNRFTTKMQHAAAQLLFRETFWQNSVARFGTAALREAVSRPSKACYQPIDFFEVDDTTLGGHRLREDIMDFFDHHKTNGRHAIAMYIVTLCYEVGRFDALISRFKAVSRHWSERVEKFLRSVSRLSATCCLAESYHLLHAGSAGMTHVDVNASLDSIHNRFLELTYSGSFSTLDSDMKECLGPRANFIVGVRKCNPGQLTHRIGRAVMDICVAAEEELNMQENMLCSLYELPSYYWAHYQKAMPGHEPLWVSYAAKMAQFLRLILRQAETSPLNPQFWRDAGIHRVQAAATGFDNVSALLAGNNNDVYKNWRDMLTTVPMLNKSQRKPYEAWFPRAKQEMMQLSDAELQKLKTFVAKFSDLLNLGEHKIVLRDGSTEEQDQAELWAGLLDDSAKSLAQWSDLVDGLQTDQGKARARRLAASEDKAEADRKVRAAHVANLMDTTVDLAERERLWKIDPGPPWLKLPRRAGLHRQAMATSSVPPSGPPQVTNPTVSNHPTPLSSNQPPAPAPAPAPASGQAQSQPMTAPQLATAAGGSVPNAFTPAGRGQLVVPREYQIDPNVTRNLVQQVDKRLNDGRPVDGGSHGLAQGQDQASGDLGDAMEWDKTLATRSDKALESWRESANDAAVDEREAKKRKREDDDTDTTEANQKLRRSDRIKRRS